MPDATQHDGATARTGLPELDLALGGLYWGDNVVWELGEGASAEPFFGAIAALAPGYDLAAYVTVEREPAEVRECYAGFEVLDARPGGPLAQPAALFGEIGRRCRSAARSLLLFDPLDAMARAWGAELAGRFFGRCCPLLLEVGAIAYWSLGPGEAAPRLRRPISDVTQCVIVVSEGRLRIAQAEGRRPGVAGTVFHYRVQDGLPELSAAPAAARLGAALRAVRLQRGLNQADLAELAGVSPSAISQAERGRRGLSLETLLELTGKLNVTLDEFLRGEPAVGYRLGRRDHPRRRVKGKPVTLPLLDDPEAGLRAYVVLLPPGASASPPATHKGVELVAVAQGLVQISLASGRPVLRRGETLLAERSGISSWRNLGESEAMLFWVLRDGPPLG